MKFKKLMACLLCAAMVAPAMSPGAVQAALPSKKAAKAKASVSVEKVDLNAEAGNAEAAQTAETAEEDQNVLAPQMGWSTWNFFREQVDEQKINEAADAMIDTGLAEAGYVYLNIDDCWQSSMRSPDTGSMMFDLDNFPSGPDLIDQLHEKGLKVGLYSSSGELTCEDLPGSYGKEAIDARAFAEWGIDYLKYDYCHVVDLPTDAQGNGNFSGLTSAPEVDYISLTPYTGTEGAESEKKVKIEAEAETVEKTGSVTVQNAARCSGGKYVTGLNNDGGDLIFKNVNVEAGGKYILTVGYRKVRSERGSFAEVIVNDDNRYEAHVARSSGWSGTARHQILIDLNAGSNEILIHNPITGQQRDSVRRYTNMGNALQAATAAVAEENGTKERPIFFSICEHGRSAPWDWAAGIGNSWRTSHDISANWTSVVNCYESSIVRWNKQIPGSYNDPDMMQVGNGSLTDVENQAHFTLWSMLSAPLILGNDIRDFLTEDGQQMTGKAKKVYDIVTNEDIIALNQDLPLLQCKRISDANGMDILVKPLKNQTTGEAEVAVCFFNKTGANNSTATVDLDKLAQQDTRLADLGWTAQGTYSIKNLWTGDESVIDSQLASGQVPAHGVAVYRVSGAEAGTVEKMSRLSFDTEEIYTAAEEQVIKAEITNLGTTDMENVVLSLEVPEDVTVKEAVSRSVTLKTGEKAVAEFHVTFPQMKTTNADAYTDSYNLKAKAEFNYKGEAEKENKEASASVKTSVPVIKEAGDSVKLGDAKWLVSTSGWNQATTKRNKSIENRTITIAGQEFTSGIGVHATSDTQIYLGGNAATFTATVGIDDEVRANVQQWPASVTFIVLADGEEIARTKEMVFGEKETMSVDVPACRILTLRADMGAANSSDHAGWGDAELTFREGKVKHQITLPAETEGGSVASDPKAEVTEGEAVTLTFSPAEGYEFRSASVNGEDVTDRVTVDEDGIGTYIVQDVTEDLTVTAVFEKTEEVEPQEKEIVSIKELEKKTVYGIPEKALEFPAEVTAVLNTNEEATAAVEAWTCENYEAWTEGIYTFEGIVAGSEDFGNASGVKAVQEVEVKLPSENIAPFAAATAPEGAPATQNNIEKKPEWVNDQVYDDDQRPDKDGVFAFKTPLTEQSYFDLNWDTSVSVDRVVLNTYFADEQGPTSFTVSVQRGSGEDAEWVEVGSKKGIVWETHNGREQSQAEIVFEDPLEDVTAMRVQVLESNARWTVSVVTEFEVFGRENCQVTVEPNNGDEAEIYQIPKGSWLNLQEPVKEGFVFEGWYTDEGCTQKYEPAAVEDALQLFAKWQEPQEKFYTVTAADTPHGKITVPDIQYKAGEEVVVTVEPEAGYRLKDGSLKANEIAIEDNRFAMPEEDVVITAVFEKSGDEEGTPEKSYTVTAADTPHGKITIPAAEYKAGEEVIVTVEPETGYRLKDGSLKANEAVIEGNRFVMPEENVTVTAIFEEIGNDEGNPEGGGNSGNNGTPGGSGSSGNNGTPGGSGSSESNGTSGNSGASGNGASLGNGGIQTGDFGLLSAASLITVAAAAAGIFVQLERKMKKVN